MSKKGFFTVIEAAKFLSISTVSVFGLIKKGRLSYEMHRMDTQPFNVIKYIPISEIESVKSERSSFGKVPEGFITCDSAANIFGLHDTTIRFMAYDKKINSITAKNHRNQPTIYIEKASLENYIQERTHNGDFVDRFFVAHLFGVAPGTVQKWARSNHIQSFWVNRMGKGLDRHRLYSKEQVEQLLESVSIPPTLPDDFGDYLSGLADGEGSFMLQVRSRDQTIQNEASFKISLRDDDLPILVLIRETLKFGRIYFRRKQSSSTISRHSTASFEINRHLDAIRLVHIFDKYPLRAKKATDYRIWREFVLERAKPDRSQSRLNQLADEIVKVREYKPPPQELIDEAKLKNLDQSFHFKSLGTGVHS